ncbi:replicative DNA helicase [Nocardia beijingensis]|uniref:replicative DNA helicase n=1 Tax=Nocardia beijingensis TaxID=95162 RepID=UPI0033BF3DD2
MYDSDPEPYDDSNERALLGAVMGAPDEVRGVFLAIGKDEWFTHRARTLAGVIAGMLDAGEHVDPQAVLVSAKNQGLVPGKVNPSYVLDCFQSAAVTASAPVIAERIRSLATCRRLNEIGTTLSQRTESAWTSGADKADVEEHLAFLKSALEEVESRESAVTDKARPKQFGELVDDFWKWVDTPPEQVRNIPTPWPEVDDILSGGLHPGRSYLFAGRPGGGKSLALTNIAAYAAESGCPGVLFSAEMGEMEVTSRILAAGGRAEYGHITRRSLDDYNRGKVAAYAKRAHEMPLWIFDKAPITIAQIRSHARRLKRSKTGLDFVAVDYVQLLSPTDSKLTRERQIAEISWGLKTMAKELDIAVISACQLNRGAAKEKRPPTIAELRESGALEQDSDVVILLHHNLIDGQPTGEVEFIVGKNRAGKLATITLAFRGHQARIDDFRQR